MSDGGASGDATAAAPPSPMGSRPPPGEQPAGPPKRRFGIGLQIYSVLLGSALLLITASFVAYYFLTEIVGYQSRLASRSIPDLIQSVEIARRGAVLVNGAARMVSVSTVEEHRMISETIMAERDTLMALVGKVEGDSIISEEAEVLELGLARFGTLLWQVYDSSARRLAISSALDALVEELGTLNRRIESKIGSAIDDQGFFLVAGLRSLDDRPLDPAKRASEAELSYYRDLIDINHQATLAGLLLGEILVLSERDLIEPLAERFRSAGQNLMLAMERVDQRVSDIDLMSDIERLVEIGESESGIFALKREFLWQLAQEREALLAGRESSTELLVSMQRLSEEVSREARAINANSQSAAASGILWLVLLNVLSILGSFLIGWLFVGRHLLRRLVGLAESMQEMAGGDLEVSVVSSGNDEITDMAKTLEVFRRHALEVQRLNLVEKLAGELDSKNHALEETLTKLQRAQDRIVAEEKLSSLGQLAAGVAHEIKNPLNFVKNFTEVSEELIDDIQEIIEESKDDLDLELSEEIKAILDDLKINLNKVREHGGRADSIVRSMLDHSRSGPGNWRDADLNALLKQYMELAYHAMRAEHPDFNAALEVDLDDTIGSVEVVPQDISRAFLNVLTNSFQALDEKRLELKDDFAPKLQISSRRMEDGFEFRIRDNGPGISDDLRQRMFEPFVTTKDAGKGTGLGLSLTVDILTRHGGTIEVDSELGEYTEMRLRLPLQPPAQEESESAAQES